ncbi:MAG: cache domain-containing protein [Pseudomonadota bacterium]
MSGNRSINLTLVLIFLVIVIGGLVGLRAYEQRTETQAVGHLTTMLVLRKSVLESYFESLRSEVLLWSSRPVVIDILKQLNRAQAADDSEGITGFGELGADAINGSRPLEAGTSVDQRVRAFAEHHQYYDVFFISPEGDVLYTVAKEADLGTNLLDGAYADSGLGRLFQTLISLDAPELATEDFSRYEPSADQPAAFLGSRVYDDDVFIGVYAIQIPEAPINQIMQFSAGMGESGETYLVGEDGLMRSTSRFFAESTVLVAEVTGETTELALRGESGISIVDDYRGIPVYSAYEGFTFEGLRWAVLAEQDVAEVRSSIIRARYWAAGGLLLVCVILLLLRFMLIRIVLPSSIAALLGLSLVAAESQADG